MELPEAESAAIDVLKLEKKDISGRSEITIQQFLDFLKTAYQVHDNLEGILMAEGMTDMVDWIKVKKNASHMKKVEKPTSLDEKDKNKDKKKTRTEVEPLMDKLNEILNEGVCDSVLPYLVPPSSLTNVVVQKRGSLTKVLDKTSSGNLSCTNAIVKRKVSIGSIQKPTRTDFTPSSEVEIHVCDEVKGIRKDFVCNQKLLVEQMGYFADVTKDQKLDDMDISVHCDITIFEWLMRWVKRGTLMEGDRPELDPSNAVPVLVSATFLQMEPLMQECLYFCHRNMNDILKTPTSLSCLNDSILTRLAAMYTNIEVESLRDRKDKIQSRLFCKLIQSLCEVEPESLRGHYCSLAKIYRCKACQQIINPVYAVQIPCIPTCMSLQPDGSVQNKHVRDPNWDLNDFIVSLYKSTKSWKKVYWKLWGSSHFLYCLICKRYFSARQEGWCRFHPDHPQFFTLDTQKPPLPVGRYPCCGERAYRFQLLDDRSGCCFRDHTISTKDVKDASIAGLLDTYRNLIIDEPPQLVFPDRLTRLVARENTEADGKLESKEVLWWDGLELIPPRPKLGLLGGFSDTRREVEEEPEEDSNSSNSEEESDQTSSSSDLNSPGSEESIVGKKQRKVTRKKTKSKRDRLWQQNLSARSNQDLQRTYEEGAFKKMASMLNTKTSISRDDSTKSAKTRSVNPAGGVWVRLETEWREKNAPNVKSKNMCNGKVRMKTTRLL